MNLQKITLGNGCFWCTEAVFESVKGVKSAVSGYMGGHTDNPNYKDVCTGQTGYAEVVQLEYDADVISLDEILLIFFKTHDPTSLNRQGADVGTQYRSVIFYNSEEQKLQAEEMIKKLTDNEVFSKPIVTEITQAVKFYKAEDYHQHYFANNPYQGYCSAVIQPKLYKFAKEFTEKIKPELL